jgi:GNAT superfamily N-acetyltransferase
MSDIRIRPVSTKKDERTFIRLPWTIYAGNPVWVPPLLMDRRKLIDRKRNPFYKHARMEMFLAEQNGTAVGRIAGIVNDNHNREHNENIGFFGFFECVDSQQVADGLFNAAAHWLKAQGVTAMRGPASPSVNDEYGLLVDGFDKPPAVLMAYNPEYYVKLVESAGFARMKDLYAYFLDAKTVFSEKLVRGAEIVRKRQDLVIRSLNMKDFDNEVALIRELYSKGWSRNWGEVPMTEEEFRYAAKDLKTIVNPRLVIIAEAKGKPVGFGLSLPDLNRVMIRNKKGYFLPFLVRYLLFRKKIDFIRIVILGVLPEYFNTGIGGVLFYETGRRAVEQGCQRGEASWVLEDNVMMNRGAELMNGERYKTYRIYERRLT